MRSLTLVVGAALLAACAKPEAPPAAEPAAAAPAPTVNLADVAGTWTVTTTPETSDSVLVTSTLVASADPAAWTLTLPGRPPMALRVSTSADTIIADGGPYESVLMKGVQVTTHSQYRLVDGKLVGMTVAHYQGRKTADSVRTLRTTGTKNP
ncbi:MAG TPA: hypothetical protein VFU23_05460 [Gemmatimonadales bacterium]|nr:hypothetical protein [Gemmatimonadales bacterium]